MRPPESFIGQPVRSLQTMLRVLAEDDPRLPTLIPDGIYGQTTLNAVAAFQRCHELPVTGITDQNTWDKIVDAYEPAQVRRGKAEPIEIIMAPGKVYRRGDQDPYLYLAQSMLNTLSDGCGTLTAPDCCGRLDDATADALAAFQKLSDLPQTGDLDRITWKHLVRQYTLLINHKSRR